MDHSTLSPPEMPAKDRERIAAWLDTMAAEPLGRRLLANLRSERNVPREVETRFWRNLAARLRAGDLRLIALDKAIDDSMLLRGPETPENALRERFSRIITIRRLLSLVADNVPLHNDSDGEEQAYDAIRQGVLSVPGSFKNEPFSGFRRWPARGEPRRGGSRA